MRLSKASYFADFVVCPPIVITLMIAALWRESLRSWIEASFACLAGIAVWTFLEYVIHRVVLHEVRFFAEMHDMHHDQPEGFRRHANMVEPRHGLLRRGAAIVVGNRFRSSERIYRRFDARLSLVRQCPPRGSSLA